MSAISNGHAMRISDLVLRASLMVLITFWFAFDIVLAIEPKDINQSSQLKQSYVWYDGDQERKIWLNSNLLAEFAPRSLNQSPLKKSYPAAKALATRQRGVRIWHLEDSASPEAVTRNLRAVHPEGKYAPVFQDGTAASGRMRSLPGNIIVYLKPDWDQTAVDSWANGRNLEIIKKLEIGPNIFVLKTGPGLEALELANTLYESREVVAAFPDWWQETVTR